MPDDIPQLSTDELLRRRQLGMQLPNVFMGDDRALNPPTDFSQIAGSTSYQPNQPPKGYDPSALQASVDRINKLSQQFPDMSAVTQAGQQYAATPPMPMARDFPRNKLLTALVAPLMFKQFIRNPQQASESLSFLTRKGYGAAEQQWAQDVEQRKRNFEIQSQVVSERARILNEELSAAEHGIGAQTAVAKFNHDVSQWPVEDQIKAAELAIAQANAKKAGQPIVRDEPYLVHTTEGDVTAQMRMKPDGSFDFTRPGSTEPIDPKTITNYGRAPVDRIVTNDERTYNAKVADWRSDPANAEWVRTHPGQEIPGSVADKFSQEIKRDDQQFQAQQRLIQIQQQQANREAQIQEQGLKRDFLATKARDANQLVQDRKPLINQAEALKGTLTAADIGDKNGVAANLAIIDQIMSGASKMNSRYNSKEFDRILGGAGKWEEFKAKVTAWTKGGPGISPQVLKQVKELVNVTQSELGRQININNKYARELEGAKNEDQVSDVMNRYNRELGDYDNWSKDVQKSPADELRDLQAEKDRRAKEKQSLQGPR